MDGEQEWTRRVRNAQWVTISNLKGQIMKAIVDANLCTGCGLCIELCPEVFEMGDDNIAKVRVEIVPPHAQDACEDAMQSCPVDAISIEK